MRKPWQIWIVFLACLTGVALAVGWLSLRALEADHAEAEIRRQAKLEENVRLALWRMDSMLAPFIAQESARPAEWYGHPLSALRKLAEEKRKVALPDAARPDDQTPTAELPKWVLLYFQFDSSGRLTSPQVPESERVLERLERLEELAPQDKPASALGKDPLLKERDEVEKATARALRLKRGVDANRLAAQLPAQEDVTHEAEKAIADALQAPPAPPGGFAGANADVLRRQQQSVLGLEAAGAKDKEVEQRNRGVDEFNVRFQYVNGNTALIRNNFEVFFAEFDGKTQAGPMTPVIVGDMLLLARRAPGAGPAVVQGCWLDWEAIRSELLATIADLLPESDLALAQSAEADASRMLASLPARLLPGALPAAAGSGLSPVQMALVVAWAAMVLAAAAVAVLLGGVITLSERRASFVSAVTHELRTPLTTFRMYSEMLADGMVPGEEARRGYLQTLRVEADRLTHLVENVLAYARLERGGLGNRIQQVDAGELLAQITGRAAERARQCGVELLVESPPEARQPQVLADPSAVEQILFNLVDNACKYAANSANAPLEISARVEGNFWRLRVRDRGPGIAAEVRARLFQPFSKSAHDAAQSAPGVGLGLALCRRLARDMHGELRLETPPGGGAAFVLSLPARGAA